MSESSPTLRERFGTLSLARRLLPSSADAEDAVRNLDLPLREILSKARQDVTTPDALRTCSPGHTLQAIFESFAQLRFHRLYVVQDEETGATAAVAARDAGTGGVLGGLPGEASRLLGVVSAKDLVAYFLQDEENRGQ